MADIAGETGLSNTSIKHVQSFLSGAFTFAQRQGALDSVNPRRDVSLPEAARVKKPTLTVWRKSRPCSASCPSLQRTVVATAAFAGLRRSELRGLRRHDFAGDERRVAGTVGENQVSDRTKTKTRASAAAVPVLPILRKALEEHRRRVPQDGYIFAGEQKGGALNLGNLVTRTIKPALQGCRVEWRGWHAYGRGLATNLYRLGVQDNTMQVILRPANISATLSVCVKSAPADAHAAMPRLEDALSASVQ